MDTHRLVPLAAAAALSLACSFAPRKAFAPEPAPAGSAALYFYRPSEMTARLIKPVLQVNGAEVGRIPNDSYAVLAVSPGVVEVRSKWSGLPGSSRDDRAQVNAEAGKRYFLRVRYRTNRPKGLTPSVPGIGGLSFEDRQGLEEVAEAEAVPQMAGMAAVAGFGAAK